jgi:hypothetical protein
MLGFERDLLEYGTFLTLATHNNCFRTWAVGRTAIVRTHPDAEAVNTIGWVAFSPSSLM